MQSPKYQLELLFRQLFFPPPWISALQDLLLLSVEKYLTKTSLSKGFLLFAVDVTEIKIK